MTWVATTVSRLVPTLHPHQLDGSATSNSILARKIPCSARLDTPTMKTNKSALVSFRFCPFIFIIMLHNNASKVCMQRIYTLYISINTLCMVTYRSG